jgi:hypothetical protein
MQRTLDLVRATDPVKITHLTEVLGVPAIRLAHQWALANAEAGFGADITWRRGDTIKSEVLIQRQEIALLAATLKRMSAKEEVSVIGEVRNLDADEHTFRINIEDALESGIREKTIHGSFDKAIASVQWPKIYRATLSVLKKIVVDDGQEETTYLLLRLDPPGGPGLILESR